MFGPQATLSKYCSGQKPEESHHARGRSRHKEFKEYQMPKILATLSNRIRFDRNELAGAFGDMGTDLPLIIGIVAASDLDAASVLIVYGLMQFFSGIWYGIPMPVQPLKAFAAIVIAQKVSGNIIYGGGLAIGIVMLFLSLTGLINWLARGVHKPGVRGI